MQTNNKLNPHRALPPGFKPGLLWLEVSAPITPTPFLFPPPIHPHPPPPPPNKKKKLYLLLVIRK